jgi:GNAT superfamily N-acetyltransferase
MTLAWGREESPRWDADKRRILGGAPAGAFDLPFADGEALAGEWWEVRDGDGGPVVGYGRLDIDWGGDAEVLLAVDPDRQSEGIGSFALDHLEQEAAVRGLTYVHNRIREHDQRDFVHDWLIVRGFRGPTDGDLRKHVRPRADQVAAPAAPVPYTASAADLGPGHEEQGGYVRVEDHRF